MTGDQRRKEQAAARRWVKSLGVFEVGDLGDAFVLGTFDWLDWGFERKPSSVFLRAADDERIYRETMDA